ncbi:hypothetical protein ULMA_00950 [Patiriisocius marinus]|uniref:Squalene cyclase C-terminal domain-containing protein n=1 Tax=Patiriisocius marinus TaxID=1397112 RepID=A0A5J4J0F3_9FLAO|nr:hypothetical protein [Patiriisocius marinus]GER57987.1 hypothetical protein ULMA_00950 [Patiriisocius marinus]
MKTKILLILAPLVLLTVAWKILETAPDYSETSRTLTPESGCVFMTVMGEQSSENFSMYKNNENLQLAVRDGLSWLSKAQSSNGGYGAGNHSAQHIMDPHAVVSDPATTAMVAAAFLRSGTTLKKGVYRDHLKNAIEYLLNEVERNQNNEFIAEARNTQIQRKLGDNIDVVLTTQFLSSLLDRDLKGLDKKRVKRALNMCVDKVQRSTDQEGKQRGAGWAGVLQSGLANSALEAAQSVGGAVNSDVLQTMRDYQKSNYSDDGNVNTADGAGVMLYSVSGSVRATAKDARKAKKMIKEANQSGAINDEVVTVENLKKAGMTETEAIEYNTSYNVYQSAKQTAQREDVVSGFGNNGGEEFLSFLQTGESLAVNDDNDWRKWYDDMSGRILKIQNQDGSWNGHHCITSPVFCTATSLLLLTIENDINYLKEMGEE